MTLNVEALAILDAHNRHHGMFETAEFRLFYISQNGEKVNTFAINRNTHTVYDANDLVRELKDLIYGDNHSIEYKLDIARETIRPIDYTAANPALNQATPLYIM